MKEIGKCNVKISVKLKKLGKCLTFTINRKLFFIGSIQFMNSCLDAVVKHFSHNDFKCLSQKFSFELLELV